MVNLKAVQTFTVAAKHLSFKLAAQELFVTQAAISQQIRQLEAQLQTQLFERLNKSIVLTAQGKILFSHTREGLEAIYDGVRAIQGDPLPDVLRISCLRSFTTRWLMPNIHEFQALHPSIKLQLSPNNTLATFEDGDTDLALRMGRGVYPGLHSERILSEELVLVGSPDLLNESQRNDPHQVFRQHFLKDTSSVLANALAVFVKVVVAFYETSFNSSYVFSGFRYITVGNDQSRLLPDQRLGFFALAAS